MNKVPWGVALIFWVLVSRVWIVRIMTAKKFKVAVPLFAKGFALFSVAAVLITGFRLFAGWGEFQNVVIGSLWATCGIFLFVVSLQIGRDK